MATVTSAGILLYRRRPGTEVLLGHPGGPFWAGKDEHAWTIPKGEHGPGEDAFAAARREFAEELGTPAPDVTYLDLGTQRLRAGKVVHVWAGEADLEADHITSNTFELEWPPRSGRRQAFAEIDRAGWFDVGRARVKLVTAQAVFLDRLLAALTGGG